MANQTVSCSLDVDITLSSNREGNTVLNMKARSPNRANMFFRFDVSSLVGKIWDSVVFKATYGDPQASFAGTVVYLSRVTQDMNYNNVTSVIYDTASNWNAAFAENSFDNDHSTRVDIGGTLDSGTRSTGDILTSPDITDIVKDGLKEANSIFDLILYSDTIFVTTTMRIFAIEGTGVRASLFFTNVQNREETTSSGTGVAVNVAVPSAVVLSKSGRPPIAGADRQVTATVLHDGVEPMKILSITLKGQFATDN